MSLRGGPSATLRMQMALRWVYWDPSLRDPIRTSGGDANKGFKWVWHMFGV